MKVKPRYYRKQSKEMLRRINAVHVRTIVELTNKLKASEDEIKRLQNLIIKI